MTRSTSGATRPIGRSGATRPHQAGRRPGRRRRTAGLLPGPCTLGGTLVYGGAPVVQSCNFDNNTNGPPYSYSPVGCETNPLYQWTWAVGGCVGTIGVECLGCTRNTTVTAKNATCNVTGVACGCVGIGCTYVAGVGNAACPNQPNTTPTGCTVGALIRPPCNPLASTTCNALYGGTTTTTTAPTGGSTLLDDSNGAGATCRHNQFTGAYVSTRFTYPSGAVHDDASTIAPAARFRLPCRSRRITTRRRRSSSATRRRRRRPIPTTSGAASARASARPRTTRRRTSSSGTAR